MSEAVNLLTLTLAVMDDLQQAFLKCEQKSVEARILSAIASVRMLHDNLAESEFSYPDCDREELRCA